MFKMCFRTYRTQKIYSPKQNFFFVNNEKIGLPRRLRKKKIEKNFMFKMCFRTHRTQKIYSPKQKKNFVNNEKYRGLDLEFFRRSEKKKLKKILCLKCVSEPIEPKKYIHQNNFFFSLTMKK